MNGAFATATSPRSVTRPANSFTLANGSIVYASLRYEFDDPRPLLEYRHFEITWIPFLALENELSVSRIQYSSRLSELRFLCCFWP